MATTKKAQKRKYPSKNRKFVVTDWGLSDAEDIVEDLKERWLDLDEDSLRYAAWVVETGETGKPHVQGFLHFNRPITLSTLKNRLKSHSIHAERVIDSEAAAHYCEKPVEGCTCQHCEKARKDGQVLFGPIYIGKKPDYAKKAAVKPTDELLELIIEKNMSDAQLLENAAWGLLRHSKGIDRIRKAMMERRANEFRKVEVILLTGDAGTGKTAWATNKYAGDYYKPDLSKNTIWFDDYQGESVLILDDFRGSSIKFENLLNLLDGYKLMLPIKGGHTYALWTTVIITSNAIPSQWYQRLDLTGGQWEDEDYKRREIAAFDRRISLHVEDIDEIHGYPANLEYIDAMITKARLDARAAKQGEEEVTNDEITAGDIGIWEF